MVSYATSRMARPGVNMLTVVADENKRREYLNRAKVMLKREFEVTRLPHQPLCQLTAPQ